MCIGQIVSICGSILMNLGCIRFVMPVQEVDHKLAPWRTQLDPILFRHPILSNLWEFLFVSLFV